MFNTNNFELPVFNKASIMTKVVTTYFMLAYSFIFPKYFTFTAQLEQKKSIINNSLCKHISRQEAFEENL